MSHAVGWRQPRIAGTDLKAPRRREWPLATLLLVAIGAPAAATARSATRRRSRVPRRLPQNRFLRDVAQAVADVAEEFEVILELAGQPEVGEEATILTPTSNTCSTLRMRDTAAERQWLDGYEAARTRCLARGAADALEQRPHMPSVAYESGYDWGIWDWEDANGLPHHADDVGRGA